MYRETVNNYARIMQNNDTITRIADPQKIYVPRGYMIEAFMQGLDAPIDMDFSIQGDLYIAESGLTSGKARILRLNQNSFEVVAESFSVPVTGIKCMEDKLYVSQKGYITELNAAGTRKNIISGLPCNGDYSISNTAFGADGKLYFGLGTATNSGVVGLDNEWIFDHPLLHDEPAADIQLVGQNFAAGNAFSGSLDTAKALTGAFSPFGVPNNPKEIKKGMIKASGCILRSNPDGTELEVAASGLRNIRCIKFDKNDRLFAANCGMDVRGSRPIANAPDEFQNIIYGTWYGWPDYAGGEPVTASKFNSSEGNDPELLIDKPPGIPPKPFAEFTPHSSIAGFDFNYSINHGQYGNAFIAEMGSYGPLTLGRSTPYKGIGNKISEIDMITGQISTFLINKSGVQAVMNEADGFGRLIDVAFGPDEALYILDMGISNPLKLDHLYPHTGIIWKVTRIPTPEQEE